MLLKNLARHAHSKFETYMSINKSVLELETSPSRFQELTYSVKDVVLTAKLSDKSFLHNLRKTDFLSQTFPTSCPIWTAGRERLTKELQIFGWKFQKRIQTSFVYL